MTLHDALDAAAEQAMTGRRLDATVALARARRERRTPAGLLRAVAGATLRRGPAALAAAAAVLLLVFLSWPALGRQGESGGGPAGRPNAPVGIPDRLWKPPPWTPLVTDRPIAAAGVALLDESGNGYLVSADGRDYRRLPVGLSRLSARFVVLSPDGRRVVWGGEGRLDGPATGSSAPYGPSVLHLLRLGGPAREIRLPDAGLGSEIAQLAWAGDGRTLYVTGSVVTSLVGNGAFKIDRRIWRLTETADRTWTVTEVCRSCETGITTRADGVLVQADPGTVPRLDPAGTTWRTDAPGVWTVPGPSGQFLLEPGGRRAVAWANESNNWPPPTWMLAVFTGRGSDLAPGVKRLALASSDGIPDVRLLTWTDQGILAVFTRSASYRVETTLEWASPQDGARRVITRVTTTGDGWALPVSVSARVASSGVVVAGGRPSTSPWTPDALRYLVFTTTSGRIVLGGAAMLSTVAVLRTGIRRRKATVRRGQSPRS